MTLSNSGQCSLFFVGNVKFNIEYIEFKTLINKVMEVLAIPMEIKEQEVIEDGYERSLSELKKRGFLQ